MPSLHFELARLRAVDEHIAKAESLLHRQQQLVRSFHRLGDYASANEAERVLGAMERAMVEHVEHRRHIAAVLADMMTGRMHRVGNTACLGAERAHPPMRRVA